MSKTPKDDQETPLLPRSKRPAVFLLGTIADVTWRLFVPTMALTLLGLYADTRLDLRPILTATGGILGFGLSAYLVYRQIMKDI